jgi:hypothetical protein
VFGGRDHAKIFRIVALHSTDESHTHAAGQERILAVCLLIAPPTRIASDIDVRGPEVQPFLKVAAPCAHSDVVICSSLSSDGFRHPVDERHVKGRGETDWLREYGRESGSRNPVQCFTPPIVGRDLQARNFARLVYQLGYLLLKSHSPHQVVDPYVDRLRRVEVKRTLGGRCVLAAARHDSEREQSNQQSWHGGSVHRNDGFRS